MPNILEELKRRNVIRVGLAYLVLSWVLLQIADVLFQALGLSDQALTLLLAILLIGFIPVVVFSWIYELTPEGVKRESEIDASQSITAHTGHRLNIAIVALLLIAVGFAAWDLFLSPADIAESSAVSGQAGAQSALDGTAQRSIAVLPFADMSEAGDQAYFADGISEELLNVLAGVDGLMVAARTSSFKFRGDEHDIVEIGAALNVSTVLEGSVRKSGNEVRITAQLIDVAGGFHLWSASYDRELDNIFAVQDEIALAIVDALKLELQLEDSAPATRSESGEAYDLYLRGRELAREPSKDGLLSGIRYFEQALDIDPNFAPALGAIAMAWVWLEDYGGVEAQEAFDKAEPAAQRALEIDPNRADALTAMGFLEERKYQDSVAARDFFERALASNPTFIEAYTLYADTLADLGDPVRALEVRMEGVERDPLSNFLRSRTASQLMQMGRLDEALEMVDEILETSPDDTYAHEEFGNVRLVQGRLADAVIAYEFVHENRPGDPYAAALISACYALMGDSEEAQRWVDAARERGANNRWELQARRYLAAWNADWDGVFRAGQLGLSRDGMAWLGEASLGKGDWEAARASFQRALSQLNYRHGGAPTGMVVEELVGLALAERQLGLESWRRHAESAREYVESRFAVSMVIGSWPSLNLNYLAARIAAVEGDTDTAVHYLEAAHEQNFLQHMFIEHDPFFTGLRDDPRLVALAEEARQDGLAERQRLNSLRD